MLTVEEKKKYTYADYLLLDEGSPFQLIENELVISPSPSLVHQLILGEFYDALKAFNENHDLGGLVILSPIDNNFDDDNVFQPDIVFISSERMSQIIKERVEGAPDIIVEILSPSNAYYDLRQKKGYLSKIWC